MGLENEISHTDALVQTIMLLAILGPLLAFWAFLAFKTGKVLDQPVKSDD